MAPRKQRANSPEFPILETNGLYASNIRGDGESKIINSMVFAADCVQGNCLFNALSDQLYGNQEMHEILRKLTIEHMRDNSEFYRQYMAVNNLRRNPKRTTTTAQTTRIDTTYYTEEQLQQQFDEHVEKMGQPGEWADNMEVSAFASALNVHVRLWQADHTYVFSPRLYYSQNDDLSAEDDRRTLHIAYHVCLADLHFEKWQANTVIDVGALLLGTQCSRTPRRRAKREIQRRRPFEKTTKSKR